MTLDLALRFTEILLALAFMQQSMEHIKTEPNLFIPRLALSILLLTGLWSPWICAALLINAALILHRFQGPYNGGSDRMGLLILICLTLAHAMPQPHWKEIAFGYLALQLILSYVMSGWVKITNPEWRSGQALQDVLRFSAYPASESIRQWANHPRLILIGSWAVMMFELIFPLTLLTQPTLIIGLTLAAGFHFANVYLFGLNRFVWVWLAAYPSIFWLQQRVFELT